MINNIISFFLTNAGIGDQIISVLENSANFEILNAEMYHFENKLHSNETGDSVSNLNSLKNIYFLEDDYYLLIQKNNALIIDKDEKIQMKLKIKKKNIKLISISKKFIYIIINSSYYKIDYQTFEQNILSLSPEQNEYLYYTETLQIIRLNNTEIEIIQNEEVKKYNTNEIVYICIQEKRIILIKKENENITLQFIGNNENIDTQKWHRNYMDNSLFSYQNNKLSFYWKSYPTLFTVPITKPESSSNVNFYFLIDHKDLNVSNKQFFHYRNYSTNTTVQSNKYPYNKQMNLILLFFIFTIVFNFIYYSIQNKEKILFNKTYYTMHEMKTLLESNNIDINKKHKISKIFNLHMISKFVINYIALIYYKKNELKYTKFKKNIYKSILNNNFKSFDSHSYEKLLTKLKLKKWETYILEKVKTNLRKIPLNDIENILSTLEKNINHVTTFLPNIILEYFQYLLLKYIILLSIVSININIQISQTLIVLLSFYSEKIMYLILLYGSYKEIETSYQDQYFQSGIVKILQKYFSYKKKIFKNSFQFKIYNETLLGGVTTRRKILKKNKDILQALQKDEQTVHLYGDICFQWIEFLKLQVKRKNKCFIHVNTKDYIILKTKFEQMDVLYKKAKSSISLRLKITLVFISKYVYSLIFSD